MSPVPIRESVAGIDLTGRIFSTTIIDTSPSAAVETTIAHLTITGDPPILLGVFFFAFVAFTIGTAGTAASVKVRRTDTSGATVVDTGLINATAANLTERTPIGFDNNKAANNQLYVVSLVVTSANAPSTVSACTFVAVVV